MIEEYIEIVREAGKRLLSAADSEVREKGDYRNLVTSYDLMTQKYLIQELGNLNPEAGFLCEEEMEYDRSSENGLFIIDPIDGTANFVYGYGLSAISVAYAQKGQLQWGIVYNPFTDEMFDAVKGKGARLNGREIEVSGLDLKQSIVAFGTSPYNEEFKVPTLKLVSDVMAESMDVRRLGSAALDLCYVAAGRAGLYFEFVLSPWDFAAGMLIVAEAGGIVTDIDFNEIDFMNRSSICAGNVKCTDEFRKVMKECDL